MYGRAREKQGSMNVITPAHATLSMEVQENWQLRNMNACTAREVSAA